MPEDVELLTVAEVATRLHIARQTIYTQVREDRFPLKPIRIGSTMRFSREDVEAFCRGQERWKPKAKPRLRPAPRSRPQVEARNPVGPDS